MKPSKTNVEFVTEMMEFSRYGALTQAFVLEAVDKYAQQVIAKQEDLKVSMKDHIVRPVTWIDIAKEVHAKCKARYA